VDLVAKAFSQSLYFQSRKYETLKQKYIVKCKEKLRLHDGDIVHRN
jgi:hypothetical protein